MSKEGNKQEVTVNEVSVHEVPANAQFIDVRERDEYAAGHAIGTVNFPLSEFAEYASQIRTDQDVYIICKSGGRSAKACEYLTQATGATAYSVAGGTLAWEKAELPMEH